MTRTKSSLVFLALFIAGSLALKTLNSETLSLSLIDVGPVFLIGVVASGIFFALTGKDSPP
jgi:hypothetical protein